MGIAFLNKDSAGEVLPQLFSMLYENMQEIAPSGNPYEQEWRAWHQEVAPALMKEPRQILLLSVKDELAGFCQYYIHDGVLMIEELQIKPAHRSTGLVFCLYRFFQRIIPKETVWIEAWADLRNQKSRCLMEKLGMQAVEILEQQGFVHYRGKISGMRI